MARQFWRLSLFYGFYFSSLGALLPYWTVYLDSLSFSAIEIGQLMAILAATKIVAPYGWGWLADHYGHRLRLVRLGAFFALLSFLPLIWVREFWSIALCFFGFSFFWNAVLPQFEVNTMTLLGPLRPYYSRIRLWGSIGFIITVFVFGALLLLLPERIIPIGIATLLLLIWLSSLKVPEASTLNEQGGRIVQVLKQPHVLLLLLMCFLLQASHGSYYTFFSIHMQQLDYSRLQIGSFWALGVLAEVLVFWFTHRLIQGGAVKLLVWVTLLTTLRWVLLASLSNYLPIVLLAQTLHAASFGLFHAATIHLIHEWFPNHQGRGQALYSTVSFGAGGAVGSFYSGYLWEWGGASWTFGSSAILAFLAVLVVLLLRWRMQDTA